MARHFIEKTLLLVATLLVAALIYFIGNIRNNQLKILSRYESLFVKFKNQIDLSKMHLEIVRSVDKHLVMRNFNIHRIETTKIETAMDIGVKRRKRVRYKHILLWTTQTHKSFRSLGYGRRVFIESKCQYTNCFVAARKTYLRDYRKFDAIVFSVPEVIGLLRQHLPRKRSRRQKYVFASPESADYYPICSKRFDGFFNWTWTYKLDSDSKWGFIVIRDSNGEIIGPNKEMHWMKTKDMKPVSKILKRSFRSKDKAAVWFVSNCDAQNRRVIFVANLQQALQKYGLNIDVYGKCGFLKCDQNRESECDKIIDREYFFYLSLESSFSEDYVTGKLLRGLQRNAIPIVFGGANYTSFMPEGSYLNAIEMDVPLLAATMNELIRDIDKYAEFFKWKNHYSYHHKNDVPETNDYCEFCALLNNEKEVKKKTIYNKFHEWWDPPHRCLTI